MKKIVFTLIVAFTGILIQAQQEHKLDNPISYYENLVIKGEKSDKEFDTSTQYAYTKVHNEIVYYDRPEKSFKYNDEAMYNNGYEFVRTDQTSYSDQKIYKNYKKYVTITVSYFLDGSLMISFIWNNPEYHNPEFTLTGNVKEASDRLKKEEELRIKEEEQKRIEEEALRTKEEKEAQAREDTLQANIKVVQRLQAETGVEIMPEFRGGMNMLMDYLSKNIKYPLTAKEAEIQGRIYVAFVIRKDGTITSVVLLNTLGEGIDEEAIRVFESMPKWKPGKKDGKKIAVPYILPLKFTLQ